MITTQPIEGRRLTTIHIGGPLRQLLETDSAAELTETVIAHRRSQSPLLVLGCGSNVILPDHAEQLSVLRYTSQDIAPVDSRIIEVESGCSISRLMGWCVQNGRQGLEFLIGIPGSLGGALAVNAGAFGQSIGSRLVSADIIDERGTTSSWPAESFGFTYRNSLIKHSNVVIIRARIEAPEASRGEIEQTMREFIRYRLAHHPVTAPSAGCFFKNPQPGKGGISAGQVIDQCGLKGLRQGDLQVSPQHANFIVNQGNADSGQVDALCRMIQKQVKDRTGLSLEREVICIGPDGKKY